MGISGTSSERGLSSSWVNTSSKINDPNADNGYTYRNGEGILLNAGWSTKGLGINLGFKGVDNMQFRSDQKLAALRPPR